MSTRVHERLRKNGVTALNWLMFAMNSRPSPGSVFERQEDEMITDRTIVSARAEHASTL
jgi:hypothetical protein